MKFGRNLIVCIFRRAPRTVGIYIYIYSKLTKISMYNSFPGIMRKLFGALSASVVNPSRRLAENLESWCVKLTFIA